jgi:hypothetical protein
MDDRRDNLPLQPLSTEEITALIAEARAAALAEIRRRLTAAFTEALWTQVQDQLTAPAPPETPDNDDDAALRAELAALREQLAANQARRTVAPAGQFPAETNEPPAQTPPTAAEQPKAELIPADGWGYYVYGVMRSGVQPSGPGIIPGTHIAALPCGDLTAIISTVPLDELDEATLAARAHDVAWIEGIVRAHQAAQEALLPLGPLVPMRLATLFTSTDNIAAMVAERAPELHATLDRLDGHGEWGVQLFADEAALAAHAAAVSPTAADLRTRIQRGGAGAAYMLQRRIERAAAEEAERIAAACAARVHERLSGEAAAATTGPLREREPGAADLMLLNGAYLVSDAVLPHFIDIIEALAGELAPLGIRVVRTGPWPAYHFV